MIPFLLIALTLAAAGLATAQQSPFGDLGVCANCHTQLTMPAGAVNHADYRLHPRAREASQPNGSPIGPSSLWSASMMAHSARDPYWKAKVRFEGGENPHLKEVIEDTCLSCHAPMQQYDHRGAGTRMALDDLTAIGEQGVGCTVCHQITPTGFGEKDSFEAGFEINTGRHVYGPHANPFSNPMVMNSGYTPVHGPHVTESALCGTCHTVITPTVDADGNVVGEFVEQSPYLEWLVSDYQLSGQSCQDCHMPVLKDTAGRQAAQYIAHNPAGRAFPQTSPRSPFGQHFLTGGNAPMLRLMAQLFPGEAELLSENLERTRESLAGAISLAATGASDGDSLELTVNVSNRTGHKLPTGFPSRRIWLHVTVLDRDSVPLFESGAWDPRTGDIIGAAEVEPHHDEIDDPDDVIIYEAEMKDTDGAPTATLLRAAGYIKDNRLLPAGFDHHKPLPVGIEPESIEPVGVDDDEDFLPGGDVVKYEIETAGREGPFRVMVEALYQSIKPGHVRLMDPNHSAEESSFIQLFANNSAPAAMARRELLVR